MHAHEDYRRRRPTRLEMTCSGARDGAFRIKYRSDDSTHTRARASALTSQVPASVWAKDSDTELYDSK